MQSAASAHQPWVFESPKHTICFFLKDSFGAFIHLLIFYFRHRVRIEKVCGRVPPHTSENLLCVGKNLSVRFAHKGVGCKTNQHRRNCGNHHIAACAFAEYAGNKGNDISAQENARALKGLKQTHCSGKIFAFSSETDIGLQGGDCDHDAELAADCCDVAAGNGGNNGGEKCAEAAEQQRNGECPPLKGFHPEGNCDAADHADRGAQ